MRSEDTRLIVERFPQIRDSCIHLAVIESNGAAYFQRVDIALVVSENVVDDLFGGIGIFLAKIQLSPA